MKFHNRASLTRDCLGVRTILGDYTKFAEGFDAPFSRVIKTTFDEAECWIIEDFTEPKRSQFHLSHGVHKDDSEPFYYLRRQPVLCGLMIFRFSLTMNEIGLYNSNQWGATSKHSLLDILGFTALPQLDLS